MLSKLADCEVPSVSELVFILWSNGPLWKQVQAWERVFFFNLAIEKKYCLAHERASQILSPYQF